MRQRAMIAMALSCNPSLLLADEPTTALDVTTKAQILDLIRELQEQFNMGVLFITHDLSMVASFADRIGVMQKGKLVETGDTDAFLPIRNRPILSGFCGRFRSSIQNGPVPCAPCAKRKRMRWWHDLWRHPVGANDRP